MLCFTRLTTKPFHYYIKSFIYVQYKIRTHNNGYYLFICVFISLFTSRYYKIYPCLTSTSTERNLHYLITKYTDCGNFNIYIKRNVLSLLKPNTTLKVHALYSIPVHVKIKVNVENVRELFSCRLPPLNQNGIYFLIENIIVCLLLCTLVGFNYSKYSYSKQQTASFYNLTWDSLDRLKYNKVNQVNDADFDITWPAQNLPYVKLNYNKHFI